MCNNNFSLFTRNLGTNKLVPLNKGFYKPYCIAQLLIVFFLANISFIKGGKTYTSPVATLALGSRPRLRGLQGCGPRGSPGVKARGSPGVTSHTFGSVRKCEGVSPHTPKATPTWEMESQWTPKTSESDRRGQTSMSCGVLYIVEKILKRRCLKWARIARLDI